MKIPVALGFLFLAIFLLSAQEGGEIPASAPAATDVGLPLPEALPKSGIPADQIEPLNKLLQELAWDAVIHHPLSGVTAS